MISSYDSRRSASPTARSGFSSPISPVTSTPEVRKRASAASRRFCACACCAPSVCQVDLPFDDAGTTTWNRDGSAREHARTSLTSDSPVRVWFATTR
jgi:hypothetical protein